MSVLVPFAVFYTVTNTVFWNLGMSWQHLHQPVWLERCQLLSCSPRANDPDGRVGGTGPLLLMQLFLWASGQLRP